MKTKENGITLITLVVTVVLILILATVGITVGGDSIKTSEFSQFKNELKVLQNKVNELNQDNNLEIGQVLDEEQKNILNIEAISNIIYKDVTDEEKTSIQNGFRFCDRTYIQENFGLDSIRRDYLINVEYRYVIAKDGFEYDGITYYIVDQLENEFYNVQYNDKNEETGSFEVTAIQEGNRWRLEITNIAYTGYINNWQVKYKLQDASYWETSDSLVFYVRDEGIYNISVIYEDKVNLGTQSIRILADGLISEKVEKNVIKIGDYVKYTPDTVATTDEEYTNLISDLTTYSGNTDTAQNTSSTITQETSLNWRVLDIVEDENGDDCVRLICDVPTTSTVRLYGAKGYNNAVYLLDKTCSTLYNNSTYAEKVQSLKIEDIEKFMVTKPTVNDKTFTPTNKKYPSIFEQEKNQIVNENTGTLGLSEQTTPINQTEEQIATSWELKKTYWGQTMEEKSFSDEKYYNLYINNEENNYSTHWISSRCIDANTQNAGFAVRYIYGSDIYAISLYVSDGSDTGRNYTLRPVITLKSDVIIDADKSVDGTEAEKAWVFKEQ